MDPDLTRNPNLDPNIKVSPEVMKQRMVLLTRLVFLHILTSDNEMKLRKLAAEENANVRMTNDKACQTTTSALLALRNGYDSVLRSLTREVDLENQRLPDAHKLKVDGKVWQAGMPLPFSNSKWKMILQEEVQWVEGLPLKFKQDNKLEPVKKRTLKQLEQYLMGQLVEDYKTRVLIAVGSSRLNLSEVVRSLYRTFPMWSEISL